MITLKITREPRAGKSFPVAIQELNSTSFCPFTLYNQMFLCDTCNVSVSMYVTGMPVPLSEGGQLAIDNFSYIYVKAT